MAMTCCSWVYAQDNDDAVLSENHVISVQKYLYVHAFQNNEDTCLTQLKKYNKDFKLIYEMNDMSCMGWNNKEENILSYEKGKLQEVEMKRNGQVENKTSYSYNRKQEEPAETITINIESGDTLKVLNTYFKSKDDRLDSSYVTAIQPDGTKTETKTLAKYNSKNDLIQYTTKDETGSLLETTVYEIDTNSVLQSVSHTTYGDESRYVQVWYEYNDQGRIVNTMNTTEQRQVYFYDSKGLITKVQSYNPKGKLELEFLYVYEFLK